MNCNCIETVEENILAHLKEKHPDRIILDNDADNSDHHPTLSPKGFTFTSAPYSTKLYFNFEFYTQFEKKDKTMSKPKKNSVNMFPSFCPFCGKSAAPLTKTEARKDVWYRLLGKEYADFNKEEMPRFFWPLQLSDSGITIAMPDGSLKYHMYSWVEMVPAEEIEAAKGKGMFHSIANYEQLDHRTDAPAKDADDDWDEDDEEEEDNK